MVVAVFVLLKAVDALGHFKVDPAMVCEGGEIVFIDEFLQDDGELYAYILGWIYQSRQIWHPLWMGCY